MGRIYEDYDDNELVFMIHDNNEDASDLLFKKYKPLVIYYAKKYKNNARYSGIEMNDLFQEGMLGLYSAINSYKEESDVKFSTFASVCIERAMGNALRNANRKKQKYLNEALSLEYVYDENDKNLYSFLASSDEFNPEKKIIDSEKARELYKSVEKVLSENEFQIFELKRCGLNYDEISEILKLNKRQIVNAMQRIRHKVSNMLAKNEVC